MENLNKCIEEQKIYIHTLQEKIKELEKKIDKKYIYENKI